tara:strand:+ start:10791 stop:11183 length:393 start_codon:yes stop_codon:yes gene_type:complete
MDELIPQIKGIDPLSSDALRVGLQTSLRTPKASIQSLSSPLEISSVNWKALDSKALMEAIGIAYAEDRRRAQADRKYQRAQERAMEQRLIQVPKSAKNQRKKVTQQRRKAGEGLFKDVARMLNMTKQKLY